MDIIIKFFDETYLWFKSNNILNKQKLIKDCPSNLLTDKKNEYWNSLPDNITEQDFLVERF